MHRLDRIDHVIIVCTGSDCREKGGKKLFKMAKSRVKEQGLKRSTVVVKSNCAGFCNLAPMICFQPDNRWLPRANPKRLQKALDSLGG